MIDTNQIGAFTVQRVQFRLVADRSAEESDDTSDAQQLIAASKPTYGIITESCSAKMLGLQRFSNGERYHRAAEKTAVERLLNPFGDPWMTRQTKNPFIPTMTGSSFAFLKREVGVDGDPLIGSAKKPSDAAKAFYRYSYGNVSDLHYDETTGRLAPDMPLFRARREQYLSHGLKKRFIGYAVLNFDDHSLFGKHADLPESFYIHKPVRSRKREKRVGFKDGSTLIANGEVFDIRRPEVRSAICKAVISAMHRNDVDGVLVDYAVRRYAFGAPELIHELPAEWFRDFQEHQHALMGELYAKCKEAGRLLYLNGVMLDSLRVTSPRLINMFAKVCDGMMWEQPFRYEWRDFCDGDDDYYRRIQQFFDVFTTYKKQLIVKCGSYRFHASEDIEPSWRARFHETDSGIERAIAKFNLCMFLLFYNRHFNRFYYSNPTEAYDIFTSESFFDFFETDIGEAVGARTEYATHVHMRVFEKAIVIVNNQLRPVALSPRRTPQGVNIRLPRRVLPPLSGTILEIDQGQIREEWSDLAAWAGARLQSVLLRRR